MSQRKGSGIWYDARLSVAEEKMDSFEPAVYCNICPLLLLYGRKPCFDLVSVGAVPYFGVPVRLMELFAVSE